MSRVWPMRRPWVALALWVVALIGVQVVAGAVGSAFHDDHTLRGTESQAVADKLASAEAQESRDSVSIVFRSKGGAVPTDPGVQEVIAQVEKLPGVESVQAPSRQAHSVSEDGTVGYATVGLTTMPLETDNADVVRIIEVAEAGATTQLEVAVGGDAAREASAPEGGSEMVGLVAALVILLVLFGSFLAASIPILSAVFAVGTAVGLASLVSHLVDVPSYATPMMMLVGLGVGIDYALLIFARYRDELLNGRDRVTAASVARRTAGRSVLFAGVVVVLALLGLVVLGLGSLRGLAVAVAVTVLLTLLASATLLPALLTLFGNRIERSIHIRAARHRPGQFREKLSDRVRDHSWLALRMC